MKKSHLGEFEEIVLLTVGILHGNAYGVSILEEIEKRLNHSVSIGSLQVILRHTEGRPCGDATKPLLFFTKRYLFYFVQD